MGLEYYTQETKFSSKSGEISVADIRNELFEGENIITSKTDYGQSQLLGNKKED